MNRTVHVWFRRLRRGFSIILVLIGVHALVLAIVGEAVSIRLGHRIELGSNVLALRFLWSRDKANLDMDVLGNALTIEHSWDRLFLQVPVPSLCLALLLLVLLFWAAEHFKAKAVGAKEP